MVYSFIQSKRFLYCVIAFLSALSIGLLIGVIVAAGRTTSDGGGGGDNSNICDNADCILSACQVLQTIDFHQNPCVDPYKFACGAWKTSVTVPDDKSVYGIYEKAEDVLYAKLKQNLVSDVSVNGADVISQTKSFYNICKTDSSDNTEKLHQILIDHGGWWILNDSLTYSDLSVLLGNMMSYVSTDYATTVFNNGMFSLYVRKSSNNMNVIYFDEPILGLHPSYLLGTDAASISKVSAYKTFMTNVIVDMKSPDTPSQIDSYVNAMVDNEKQLAKYLSSVEERRNKSWDEVHYTLAEFQNYFMPDQIKLQTVLQNLFNDSNLNVSETISMLQSSNYVRNIFKNIDFTNSTILNDVTNYVIWRFVQSMTWHVGGPLRQHYNDFQTSIGGMVHQQTIDDVCVRLTNSLLSFTTARLYVDNNFDSSIVPNIESMFKQVQKQFTKRLDELADKSTFNISTINAGKDKVNKMAVNIAYPNWLNDNSSINSYYPFDNTLDMTHFENVLTILKSFKNIEMRVLRQSLDQSRWIIPPVSLSANYDPLLNSITLPIGVLESPYYRSEQLSVSNFARLGVIIARQLVHGFNVFGRQLSGDGVLINWWTDDDVKTFNSRAQCFLDQYNNYCVTTSSGRFCVDGDQTLDENIVDNGALYVAYQAAIMNSTSTHVILPGFENYTDPQIFFIQYASMECETYREAWIKDRIATGLESPREFRVKGTLSNSAEAVSQFGCFSNTSSMCTIW